MNIFFSVFGPINNQNFQLSSMRNKTILLFTAYQVKAKSIPKNLKGCHKMGKTCLIKMLRTLNTDDPNI